MSNSYKDVEKVCGIRSRLGEGPCWDEINKNIYWIDIVEKAIHSYSFINNNVKTIHLKKYIGSMGLTNIGGIVATLQDGYYIIDNDTGSTKLIKEVEENRVIKRFNDGKIDRLGNYWAGTVSYDEKKAIGMLYCLKTDMQLKRFFNGITISNGITWSPDNRKMYYIDTPTMKVDVFDFDIEKVEISNRKTAIYIPTNVGYPDGMTIDIEGKLWIAHWGGYQVCRWDPERKKILEKINLPAKRVSCCTFAGDDMDELFITTAGAGFTETLNGFDDSDSGFLYRAKTSTRGFKNGRFRDF
jgi:sugar lactone lactonase YvrE